MKKIFSALLVVLLTAALFAGGGKESKMSYKAGTYTASAQGMNGEVNVSVTFSNSALKKIEIGTHKETPGISDAAIEKMPLRIVEKQSLAVDTVSGATISSKAILMAVEKTLIAAGADIAAWKSPLKTKQTKGTSVKMKSDVVVIGAGAAGVAAALSAHDKGAKVILLEKMPSIGGTTATSQGLIGGFESKYTKALNVHYSFEQMYANLMNNASYRLDPALAGITVKNSGEIINWLNERFSMPFKDEVLVGYGPLQMMHQVENMGSGVKSAMEATLKKSGITLMLETRANEILMDESGNVRGVKASSGANTIVIYADSVVIASGGYSNNPALSTLLDPEKRDVMSIGFTGATGDGLIMASNVGAALTHTDHMMCVLKDYEIMAEHQGTSASASVSAFMSRKNTVLLGADGKRFVNEKDSGYMSQKLNSPIFDQMHRDALPFVWAVSDQASLNEKGIKRGLNMDFISAYTPEELAEKMGLNGKNVANSINNYNSYVEKSFDPEFGRTVLEKLNPPFVAVRVTPCQIITYGGIARNKDAQVLRADGSVIPGLYVAGEAGANSSYMGFTLANAFVWGRIAGDNAADFAAKK